MHYKTAKQLLAYLYTTKTDSIYFWRTEPRPDLPDEKLPTTKYKPYKSDYKEQERNDEMEAAVNSDWALDAKHRKSVSGICIMIAGGCILYKSKFQDSIALSSMQVEFAAACEAGKCILYVRTLLEEIGLEKEKATTCYIDNNRALLMANAQQPTKRIKHVDLKQFALLEWAEIDLIQMQQITTADNYANGFTKLLRHTLHYRDFDRIMG